MSTFVPVGRRVFQTVLSIAAETSPTAFTSKRIYTPEVLGESAELRYRLTINIEMSWLASADMLLRWLWLILL